MDRTLLQALVLQFSKWGFGPSPRWACHDIMIVLNAKLRVYINVDEELELRVMLQGDLKTPARNGYEIIWAVQLADPKSFDKLPAFLRRLPNDLAKIDPAKYAIDPFPTS